MELMPVPQPRSSLNYPMSISLPTPCLNSVPMWFPVCFSGSLRLPANTQQSDGTSGSHAIPTGPGSAPHPWAALRGHSPSRALCVLVYLGFLWPHGSSSGSLYTKFSPRLHLWAGLLPSLDHEPPFPLSLGSLVNGAPDATGRW